jgi:hypothetical protein
VLLMEAAGQKATTKPAAAAQDCSRLQCRGLAHPAGWVQAGAAATQAQQRLLQQLQLPVPTTQSRLAQQQQQQQQVQQQLQHLVAGHQAGG